MYTASNGTRFGKAEIMQGFADTTTDDENAAPVVYSGEDVRIRVYGDSAVVAWQATSIPARDDVD